MSTLLRTIGIPLFIKVGSGVLRQIRRTLDENHLHFAKPIILSEPRILDLGGNDIVHELGDPATIMFKKNSIEEGERIAQELKEKGNDLMISIGGGRIVDLGKYAATKAGIDYISVPTSPSNDGICSPIAVLENETGATESLGVNMPIGILVDSQILTSAPEDNIRSGIGELVSNFSSIQDWRIAYEDGKEGMDDFAASIAFSAAQLIYETCRGVNIDLRDVQFLEKLTHGLILSGIAMNVSGNSRPCSGSEHEVSHAMDLLFPGNALHGQQVAYGTLLMSYCRGENIDHLVDFFERVRLPVTHDDLGLTEEQVVEALVVAPSTRPGRYTVLEKKNLDRGGYAALVHDYTAYVTSLRQ